MKSNILRNWRRKRLWAQWREAVPEHAQLLEDPRLGWPLLAHCTAFPREGDTGVVLQRALFHHMAHIQAHENTCSYEIEWARAIMNINREREIA